MASVLLALGACEGEGVGNIFGGSGDSPAGSGASATPAAGKRQVVEAPEIFDVTDTALWDGRPSLGLIWVAYEGADPTSVVIRNQSNGKSVNGARYRRERFFPGPPFQLSSDAAAALGILAGNPTEIQVTALKEIVIAPEPVEPEPVEPAPAEEAETADIVAPDELPAPPAAGAVSAAVDPIAAAAAAIEKADPMPEAPAPAVAKAPPPRPTVEGPNAPQRRPMAIPEPEGIAPAAPVEATPVAVAEPIAETPAPVAPVSKLRLPFIQVGIYSVRENAEAAADSLGSVGIAPFVSEQIVGGRTMYRVLVGPASDAQERSTLLETIKAQGFSDAYFVRK